jgi:GDP/UDP-N,N'-diacetylbacillosamine 2-epimerase (hydrolysing)
MSDMKNLCFVTGTRAEFGLLLPLMRLVKADTDMRLQLVVTGAHLAPEFGLTVKEVEESGLGIDERVEALLSSDTPVGTAKSMGLALIGLSEAFARLRPHMLVLLGDRTEVFCAAAAAAVMRIPVAHIHGGEATEGAVDELLRHAVTKMSYLHFTSTEEYRRRVIQLGEDPGRVHRVGALGLDFLKGTGLLSREEIESRFGIRFKGRSLLVTFHPPTLEPGETQLQVGELLAALAGLQDTTIIFTKANADAGGRAINAALASFAADRPGSAYLFDSLGHVPYLSLMREVDAVVGNSSSGILEAPSLHVATVNIGDRQRGRVMAASTICCPARREQISAALAEASSARFRAALPGVENPYGDGSAAPRIRDILRSFTVPPTPMKRFHDLAAAGGIT